MNGETLIRVLAVWESCDIHDGITWRRSCTLPTSRSCDDGE